MSKKLVSIILGLVMATSSTSALAADGDSWVPNVARGPAGTNSFFIAEATQGNLLSTRVGGSGGADWWCADFSDSRCDLAKTNNWYYQYSVLPACAAEAQENCVEGLELRRGDSESVFASFERQIDGIKFPAEPKIGSYEGSTVSLWNAENLGVAGGKTNYAINVRVLQGWNRSSGKFEPQSLSAIVMPYREQSGNYSVPVGSTIENAKGTGKSGVAINGIAQECVWNDSGKCGIAQQFPEGTRASLTFRLSNKIGGWFMGRLSNPNITITKFSSTANRINVEAAPVAVPRLQATVSQSTGVPNIQGIWRGSGVMGSEWDGSAAFRDGFGGGAFDYLDAFRPHTNDIAAGISNLWSFGSVASGQFNSCLSDTSKVMGIVTTNATVYDAGVPLFRDGQLSYRVGGLHFAPDGQGLNLGSYDLVIRSEAARCLYGFSKSPVQASISVISDSGTKVAATTVVSEKDGWLKLAANGFTFSNKVIKAKLTQTKVKSITCKKGKVIKKVTAISPKCPAGFKKN